MHRAHHTRHVLSQVPVEPIVAVVLSASGLLSSWSAYQAELWGAVQLESYSRAGQAQVQASRAAMDGSMTRAVEVSLFRAWAEAQASGDERLARFYEARFTGDLSRAFQEWRRLGSFNDPDAPPSPFALPSYRPLGYVQAAAHDAQADRDFKVAVAARHTSDAYTRGSVVLASAMFLAGIGQVFKQPTTRAGLTLVCVLTFIFGAALILRLPMQVLGGR